MTKRRGGRKPAAKRAAPKRAAPKRAAPAAKRAPINKSNPTTKASNVKYAAKKGAAPKTAAKKSSAAPKKGVKIYGIQGRVNLGKDVLKPLKQGIQSVKPDFTNKDWKSIRKPFKKAAKDGKITKKELARIRSLTANTSGKDGFTYNEGQLAFGAIPNAINAKQYDRYVNKAQKDMQSFRKNQDSTISNMMKTQRQAMQSQLAQIQGGANSSLNSFKNTLNKSTAQSQKMLQDQRNTFAKGNAASMQNVRRSQSQIKALPSFQAQLTDQISSSVTPVNRGDPFLNIGLQQAAQNIRPAAVASEKFSPVQGMDAFSSIGVNRDPISVKRDPTIMGLSTAQTASSNRQQQGIQGFRTKQVA